MKITKAGFTNYELGPLLNSKECFTFLYVNILKTKTKTKTKSNYVAFLHSYNDCHIVPNTPTKFFFHFLTKLMSSPYLTLVHRVRSFRCFFFSHNHQRNFGQKPNEPVKMPEMKGKNVKSEIHFIFRTQYTPIMVHFLHI